MASGSSSSGPPDQRDRLAGQGRPPTATTTSRCPDIMRVAPMAAPSRSDLATGFDKDGRHEWSAVDAPAGAVARTGRPSRSSRTPRTRREDNVVLQFFNIETKKLPRRRPGDRPCSGTRTPSGGPTAGSCCTCRTAATAPRGAGDLALRHPRQEGRHAHRPRLHAAVLFARRSIRRGDPHDALGTDVVILDARNGRRAPAGHRRRRVLGADLVAGRRRDRVPPHRRADRRPAAGRARGRRRRGRSRRPST